MTSTPDGIYGFSGATRWLSNFYLAAITYDGAVYPSTEHAYQAAKTLDTEERKPFQLQNHPNTSISCRRAKALGYKITLRPDWEDVKRDVMFELVFKKFTQHLHLRRFLLTTKDVYLEETNTWKDTYWGVCDGQGRNELGKILMEVREILVVLEESEQ